MGRGLFDVKIFPGTLSPAAGDRVHGRFMVLEEYERIKGGDSDAVDTETEAFERWGVDIVVVGLERRGGWIDGEATEYCTLPHDYYNTTGVPLPWKDSAHGEI